MIVFNFHFFADNRRFGNDSRIFRRVNNCGRCLRACPMQLNPAAISKAVEADDIADAESNGVMNCIECGACSFGCPAYRSLTHHCRRAKDSIRARQAAEKAKAAAAAKK